MYDLYSTYVGSKFVHVSNEELIYKSIIKHNYLISNNYIMTYYMTDFYIKMNHI